jgi:tetratricopeptide (TPR) repeat protein
MPETNVQHGKTFDENIDILFDEIVLAEQWGRPSLLLAVHKSKFGQDKAETDLEKRLVEEGFQVDRIVFNDRRSDIAHLLREAAPSAKRVFFISNVDWGGGDDGRQAYRGLNLHRELFVDEAIKAVFWLTVNEAANLPRFAPDFWAFRHRVVEFVSQRAGGKVHLPTGILAWGVQPSADPFDSAAAGIEAREELLRRLPDTLEALSARVELHGSLGYLHWSKADLVRASQEFEEGLETAGTYDMAEHKASLLNGIGIIHYERGDPKTALEKFTEGLKYRSSSRVLLINVSAADCMLGRIQEALAAGQKAVRANPTEADTWRRLGYIQNAAGRPDEAINCIAKAAELAPRAPEHRVSLAVMYNLVDRPDDARLQLTRARELGHDETGPLLMVIQEAALGKVEEARGMLAAAVAAGTIAKHEVRRDLNLALLFEAGELEEMLG